MLTDESTSISQINSQSSHISEPIKTVDGKIHVKKYLKIKEIGKGSYSKCFLVKNIDCDSASTYAVKVIPKQKLQSLMKEKLFYEIKIHQSLSHPNVVYLDHWFEDESFQYIFMEYCSNGNLDTKLKSFRGVMPEKQIKGFAYQIVQSIQYIHSQNIMHRDLKLNNFYLNDSNIIKLGDFGFACQLANEYDRKRQSCGTPNFIAPEAISGFGYSFSSDVWSIGVILFRLKFGFCPFEGGSVKQTLEKVRMCEYWFPKGISISWELKDLIKKILNINYDERLTTQQILDHPFFRDICGEETAKAQMSPTPTKNKNRSLFSQVFSQKGQLNSTVQPSRQVKKSNSCQTLKEIKEIFKSKGKRDRNSLSKMQTLPNETRLYGTEQPSYSTTISLQTLPSMSPRFDQQSFSQGVKRSESGSRLSRLNKFIKEITPNIDSHEQAYGQQGNIQGDSLTNKAKAMLNFSSYKSNLSSINKMTSNSLSSNVDESGVAYRRLSRLLNTLLAKLYLPYSIQHEKDVIVVHYSERVKQVIYNCISSQNSASLYYLVYFCPRKPNCQQSEEPSDYQQIFSVQRNPSSGPLIKEISSGSELPKVVAYILENKLPAPQQTNSAKHLFAEDECPTMNRVMHQVEEEDEKVKRLSWDLNINESIRLAIIHKMLDAMGQYWITAREGIILKYYQPNGKPDTQPIVTVSKLKSRKEFYLTLNDSKFTDRLTNNIPYTTAKTRNKTQQAFLYERKNSQQLQVVQEIGSLRMYISWFRTNQSR